MFNDIELEKLEQERHLINKDISWLLQLQNKFLVKRDSHIESLKKDFLGCYKRYFSYSEIDLCTEKAYIQTAQNLTLLYSEVLTEIK